MIEKKKQKEENSVQRKTERIELADLDEEDLYKKITMDSLKIDEIKKNTAIHRMKTSSR